MFLSQMYNQFGNFNNVNATESNGYDFQDGGGRTSLGALLTNIEKNQNTRCTGYGYVLTKSRTSDNDVVFLEFDFDNGYILSIQVGKDFDQEKYKTRAEFAKLAAYPLKNGGYRIGEEKTRQNGGNF